MDEVFVGIDVSKDRLDVHADSSGATTTVARDAGGVESLVDWLRPLSAHLVAVEATGGFETVVAASLAAAGMPVVVVNPAQVRSFAQALGKTCQDRPNRRGGDRPFRCRDQAGGTAIA